MNKWTRPSCYIGAEWPEHFVFLGQNRDSDALTRSNFRSALKAIGGEKTEEINGEDVLMVAVIREDHWAVGWVEWIAIHESNVEAIRIAEEIESTLSDYPVVDEMDYSELENDECAETWENCYSPSERVEYFRRHSYTATSLSDLLQAIRSGSWYHAANMLHCPSDLLY